MKGKIPRGDALGDYSNPLVMFIGESDFEQKVIEWYVNDHLMQHYFVESCNNRKVKWIIVLEKLFK